MKTQMSQHFDKIYLMQESR